MVSSKKKLGGDGGEIDRHSVVSCGRDARALHVGGSSLPHTVPGTCPELRGFWLSCCGGGSAARKQLALSWVGQGAGFLPAHLCSLSVTTAPFAALGRTCPEHWHPNRQPQGHWRGNHPCRDGVGQERCCKVQGSSRLIRELSALLVIKPHPAFVGKEYGISWCSLLSFPKRS